MEKGLITLRLSQIMQGLIFVSIFLSAYRTQYMVTIAAIVALGITFLPAIIKKKWHITLPLTLNFLIVLSLYLHIGGATLGLYHLLYPFYDKFGHFLGSVTVALLGFSSAVVLNKFSGIKLKKIHVVLFIIMFTMAIGSLWEIGEFTVDKIWTMKNQYSLDDTMYDLIFDLVGALLIALITTVNFETMKKEIKLPKT